MTKKVFLGSLERFGFEASCSPCRENGRDSNNGISSCCSSIHDSAERISFEECVKQKLHLVRFPNQAALDNGQDERIREYVGDNIRYFVGIPAGHMRDLNYRSDLMLNGGPNRAQSAISSMSRLAQFSGPGSVVYMKRPCCRKARSAVSGSVCSAQSSKPNFTCPPSLRSPLTRCPRQLCRKFPVGPT